MNFYDQRMSTTSKDVRLRNAHGQRLAATLCLPAPGVSESQQPIPAVLLCQGLSGVRQLVLPDVSEHFAAQGIATLRFDYSGFGESDGDRGWIDPVARVADARFALAYLMSRPEIDEHRVGIYGHSYGGPVALHVAASERRLKAAVAVSGPGDGADLLRAARPAWDWIALQERLRVERIRIAQGADPEVVDVSEIMPFSPAFNAAYAKLKESQGGTSALPGTDGLGKTAFYLVSVDAMVAFRPAAIAPELTHCPTILINGDNDDTAPVETVDPVYRAIPGPKRWVIIPGADHNTLDTEPGLSIALGFAAEWFKQYL